MSGRQGGKLAFKKAPKKVEKELDEVFHIFVFSKLYRMTLNLRKNKWKKLKN